MARRDYYDDQAAPPANAIVPAVTGVVLDDRGCLKTAVGRSLPELAGGQPLAGLRRAVRLQRRLDRARKHDRADTSL
jgi:hypothetical protein